MGLWGRIPSSGEYIDMAIQPLPIADIMASAKVVHDEPDKEPLKGEASPDLCPIFGTIPTPKWLIFILKNK